MGTFVLHPYNYGIRSEPILFRQLFVYFIKPLIHSLNPQGTARFWKYEDELSITPALKNWSLL